jgi:hypothetical protein
MNLEERKLLDRLDSLVLNASDNDLQKIQELDLENQLTGKSFYDTFLNSQTLINQTIRKESKDFKK